MLRKLNKILENNNGKASKPNLAVIILCLIVILQTIFLWKAYGPKHKTSIKPKQISKVTNQQSQKPIALPAKQTPLPSLGKIAIIIDDSGYSSKDCAELAAIDAPVTISILPQLPFSAATARCANSQGKGVMLHLPLEPHVMREKYPNDYFIKTDMSAAAIRVRAREAIESIPFITGVNNHEGSKATEDSRVMSILFKELVKQNLFFVDSRVTPKSVCPGLAEQVNLPFTGRDVFLDNINERSAIEKQFRELATKASQRGTAVAIGHARTTSWPVMQDQIKKLQAQGYEFVSVPEIIRSQDH